MISFTPGDHVDSPDLLKAHEKLVRIANQIENESAEAQSISRVLELANMFIYDGVPFKLVSPSRRYIMETESLSIFPSYSLQDNCRVFLFNDMIIWAKKKRDKYNVLFVLNTCEITNLNSIPDGKKIGNLEIFLGNSDKKISMILPKKQDLWYEKLQLITQGAKAWRPHLDRSVERQSISIKGEVNYDQIKVKKQGRKRSLQEFVGKVIDHKITQVGEIKTILVEKSLRSTDEKSTPKLNVNTAQRAPRYSLVHSSNFRSEHIIESPISDCSDPEFSNCEGDDKKKVTISQSPTSTSEVREISDRSEEDDDDEDIFGKPTLNRSKSVDGRGDTIRNFLSENNTNVRITKNPRSRDLKSLNITDEEQLNKLTPKRVRDPEEANDPRDDDEESHSPSHSPSSSSSKSTYKRKPKSGDFSVKLNDVPINVLKSFSDYVHSQKGDKIESDDDLDDNIDNNNNNNNNDYFSKLKPKAKKLKRRSNKFFSSNSHSNNDAINLEKDVKEEGDGVTRLNLTQLAETSKKKKGERVIKSARSKSSGDTGERIVKNDQFNEKVQNFFNRSNKSAKSHNDLSKQRVKLTPLLPKLKAERKKSADHSSTLATNHNNNSKNILHSSSAATLSNTANNIIVNNNNNNTPLLRNKVKRKQASNEEDLNGLISPRYFTESKEEHRRESLSLRIDEFTFKKKKSTKKSPISRNTPSRDPNQSDD